MLGLIARLHGRLVHRRRVRVLAGVLAPWLPEHGTIIDVGCGDGALAAELLAQRPDVGIEGYDVLVRENASIPVRPFDGRRLPLPDAAVDAVVLVDVLHHCHDPEDMLREAVRVARRVVIVKDHRLGHPAARLLLRLMDWVGNRPHGVVLPYNYWPESRWREAWRALGVEPAQYRARLGLYPFPFSLVLDRGLHFAAALTRLASPTVSTPRRSGPPEAGR
jgi:SAM-dependent methyltransferase